MNCSCVCFEFVTDTCVYKLHCGTCRCVTPADVNEKADDIFGHASLYALRIYDSKEFQGVLRQKRTRAVLLQGGPRDAAIHFDTIEFLRFL